MGIESFVMWNRFLESSILTQTKKNTGNLAGGKSNALVRSRSHLGLFDVLKEFIDQIGIVATINSESKRANGCLEKI